MKARKRKKLSLDALFFRAYSQLERLLNLRLDELTTDDVEAFRRLHIKLFDYYTKQLQHR